LLFKAHVSKVHPHEFEYSSPYLLKITTFFKEKLFFYRVKMSSDLGMGDED
jgi:hypothetical protein